MRCYLIRRGRIVATKELAGLSDQQAIERARTLFDACRHQLDSFEVWDCSRMVHQSMGQGSSIIRDLSEPLTSFSAKPDGLPRP